MVFTTGVFGDVPSIGARQIKYLIRPTPPQNRLLHSRIREVGLRAPAAAVLVALALAVLAILGIERIKTDDALSQLFRSDDPEFKQFEQVSRDFPSSEYDVLIVVSGQTLLARESVAKLRSLVTDIQLIDGARGVLSMFSMRQPAPEGGLPDPSFPTRCRRGTLIKGSLLR